MSESKLRSIIQLHQYTKELILLGEEIGPEMDAFLQPKQEHWHAYDHIIRALAYDLKMHKPDSLDYDKIQYKKALGHEYRAFFDTADYLALVIRQKIIEVMKPFDYLTIGRVFPKYYAEIRPKIDKINREISSLRNRKDIADDGNILVEVEEYKKDLDALYGYLVDIQDREQALLEEHAHVRKELFNLRKEILDLMEPFDNETIEKVFPAYYSEVLQQIDEIGPSNLQEFSGGEIASRENAMDSEDQEHLQDLLLEVKRHQRPLSEYVRRHKRMEKISFFRKSAWFVATASIGALIGAYLKSLFEK